jgi:hypothetical protein
MDSLYQRLKELKPDAFQKLCFHILKERHTGLQVRHVEGAGGDEGLDVFAGELSGKPAIWQCKSFPSGLGKSQKEKIKKSLQTALKHFTPSYWILCLSVGMDTKAHRWFQRLQKSYESQVKIELLDNMEIVHELAYRRTLRNIVFPGAVFDLTELRRIVSKSGEKTTAELEKVTDAYLEDEIERWKERDARFNYQILFDGDLGPPRQTSSPAGLMMSIRQGDKTVNVIARDQSLKTNPPQFSTVFKGTGVKKYEVFVKTGVSQEFETDEVGPITSDWPLLSDVSNVPGIHKLSLAMSPVVTNRKRSVRVDFVGKNSCETVRYELMELRPIRMGQEEFEISLSSKNVPFKLSLVLPTQPTGDATFTVENDWAQREFQAIKKSLDAFNLCRPSGTIHIFDLEAEKHLLDVTINLPSETPQQEARRSFMNDVVTIAAHFGVTLKLPDKITKDDFETIYVLKQYMENEYLELDNISTVVVKSEENQELLPRLLASGKGAFRFENMQAHNPLKLFGTVIDTGPLTVEGDLEINDLVPTLQSFQEAEIGTGVKMSFKPLSPVRVSLLSKTTEP